MTTLCALCRAVDDHLSDVRPTFDRHLLVSTGFVVMPAVGPITPGHVLIVSREHLPNLASTGRRGVDEYNELILALRAKPWYTGEDCLEAEHGASLSMPAGGCINHVHVNFIPQMGRQIGMLDGLLQPLVIDAKLNTLDNSAAPYILLRTATAARLYDATRVQSQLIRRVLFERVGRDDWDWGAFPQLPTISETLRMWDMQVESDRAL